MWRVESRQVQVGSDFSLGLVLANAPRGLQRYEVTVSVRNGSIAKIVSVEGRVLTGPLFKIVQQSETQVRIQGLDVNNAVRADAKNIILALLTFKALQAGKTEVTVETHSFIDDSNARATPTVEPGIIEVLAPTPPPPQPPPTPPTTTSVPLGFRGNTLIRLGAEATVELLTGALPNGLQKYHLRLTLSDGAIARFKSVRSLALDERFFQVLQISDTLLEFRAADLKDQIRPGAQNLALVAIAIEGKTAGTIRMGLEVKSATDDQSQPLVFAIEPLDLAVSAGPPTLEPGARPPQDLDGDGLYEDVNGDGKLTFDDPTLLAFHIENPIAQEHKRFFDFNRDGVLNFEDVKALTEIVESRRSFL